MISAEAEVITDMEFIFLGGTKLVHTLRETDTCHETGDYYKLEWCDTGEVAYVYKAQLLQFGCRVRMVKPADQTAVKKVIEEIKQKEARAQVATGGTTQALVSALQPAEAPVSPQDLWDRSPLGR